MKFNLMKPQLLQGMGSLRAMLAVACVALLAACGGGGEVTVAVPATAVSTTNLRVLPAEYLARKAVNYGPFRTADRGAEIAGLVDPVKSAQMNANIKQDLELLVAGNFKLIRLFDVYDGPIHPLTGVAVEGISHRILRIIDENSLDIKVHLGSYMNSVKFVLNPVVAGDIRAKNQQELERQIVLANHPVYKNIVLVVSVGNETMVGFSPVPIPPADMAVYIKYVRDRVSQPTTTDDDFQFWREAPRIITDQIDFVAAHLYPEIFTKFPEGLFYYDWKQEGVAAGPARAVAMMNIAMAKGREVYQQVRDRLDRNGLTVVPVVITEVGWNAVDLGQLRGRAHPVNQKMFFDRLAAFRAEGRVGPGPGNIFYFEAFDEPWKGGDDKWGLFNVNREARFVVQNLYSPAIWEAGTFTEADAVFFTRPVPNLLFGANKYTLFSDALGAVVATGLRVDAFDGNSVSAPEVTMTAPLSGDGSRAIELTPVPKDYGWGLLYSSATPYGTENLKAFEATGTLNLLIKTTYPGKIEIGISTDTVTGDVQETYLQIGSGDFGYQNDGNWHLVSIPLQSFLAVNPKLDLSLVLTRFAIADRYSFTGKSLNSNITTKIQIDGIQWSR
jgi:hypothetical protein